MAPSAYDRLLLVGECKWRSTKMTPASLDDLQQRAQRFPRLRKRALRYALFSRSGFTKALHQRAEKEGVLLFEGAQLRQR